MCVSIVVTCHSILIMTFNVYIYIYIYTEHPERSADCILLFSFECRAVEKGVESYRVC